MLDILLRFTNNCSSLTKEDMALARSKFFTYQFVLGSKTQNGATF